MNIVVFTDDENITERICTYIEKYTVHKPIPTSEDPLNVIKAAKAEMLIVSINNFKLCNKDNLKASVNGIIIIILGNDESDVVYTYRDRLDGFILSSRLEEDLEYCLENAMYLSNRIKRVYAVTFGRFALYKDGKNIVFKNKKSKELLALCIDRCGNTVSIEEATDKLWSGRTYDKRVKGLYRKAVMDLKRTLASNNIENIFESGRCYCCINHSEIMTDYYVFMNDPKKYLYLFGGEYMSEYSWAESTLAKLHMVYSSNREKDFL